MSLGKFPWQKSKRDPGDAARAAAAATTLTSNPDGTASYRGWIIAPDMGSGQYLAQKPGTLDTIIGTSLPVLKIQIDAAETSGANPNAPVAVYQGWSIIRAGGAGSSYNPFSLGASSGPLYVATQAGRAWPARKPHTLQEVYAIIDRIVNGESRPQDAVVEEYQGWSIRQVETDGRFYAKNPSTAQQIGGMPTLSAVRARIDQYTQPQQMTYPGGQVPYYQQGSPSTMSPYGYQQPYQPQPYYQQPYGYQQPYQQPVQRDMWGNPIQNSYVPQTSADPSAAVPISSVQPQLPYQPTQANQISYYQPVPAQQAQPVPSQGADEYGYSDAYDDDATYTGTNGLDGSFWSNRRNRPNRYGTPAAEIYNGWTILQDWNTKRWGASKTNGQRIDGVDTRESLKAAIDRQNLADAGVSSKEPELLPTQRRNEVYSGWRLVPNQRQWYAERIAREADGSRKVIWPANTVADLKAMVDKQNLADAGASPVRTDTGMAPLSPTPTPSPAPTPTKPTVEAPTVGGNAVRYGNWLIRAGDPTSPGHYNQQPFFASNGALMAIGQTFPDIIAKIDKAERDKPTQLDGLGEITAHQAMGGLLALGAVAGAVMVAHQLSRRRK